MKLIRYIFIAGLLYFLVTLTYYAISPSFEISKASEATDTEPAVTLPSNYPEMIAAYRSVVVPWIILMSLILSGWLFWNRARAVLVILAISFAALAYLVFLRVRGLGYTLEQSLSAISQDYKFALFYESLFCLVAILSLLAVTLMRKRSDNDGTERIA